MTCLMAPSLPAASIAWKIKSTPHLSWAYSLSCSSARAVTPVTSASFALGLSASFVNSRVSSGSTSLRRKSFPLLIQNGLASSLALLMISFVFIRFPMVHSEPPRAQPLERESSFPLFHKPLLGTHEIRQLLACKAINRSCGSGRRQKIQRRGEYQINQDREHADEPGGAARRGHQRGGKRCEQNHCDCTGPEIQIHRRGADQITQQYQNRSNEKCNLRGAAKRNAHAQIEMIFARGGKCSSHFRSRAHQGHNDEPNKGRTHSEGSGSVLNGSHKHFAHQCDENRNTRERGERETDRPRRFMFFGRAVEQFTMRVEREPEAQTICEQTQKREREAQGFG